MLGRIFGKKIVGKKKVAGKIRAEVEVDKIKHRPEEGPEITKKVWEELEEIAVCGQHRNTRMKAVKALEKNRRWKELKWLAMKESKIISIYEYEDVIRMVRGYWRRRKGMGN